ncbi:MAG: protein-disulfide reductase DsbD domain-containing protein [Dehalococcoidia bacterium]
MVHDVVDGQGVTVSAELTATELRNRQHADIYVTLDLDEGLHVYGQPIPKGYVATEVKAVATEGILVGEPQFPPTTPFKVEGLTEEFHAFDGKVEIVVPVVSTVREEGDAAVDLEVSFQACTDQMCYIPRTEKLRLEFTTAPGVRRQPS